MRNLNQDDKNIDKKNYLTFSILDITYQGFAIIHFW